MAIAKLTKFASESVIRLSPLYGTTVKNGIAVISGIVDITPFAPLAVSPCKIPPKQAWKNPGLVMESFAVIFMA